MKSLLLLPFLLQGLVMFFDEYYFHRKRTLPLWERVGHPLDTLSVLICLGWTQLFAFNELNIKIYGTLAFASCLFVTKDEFVHHSLCTKHEQWLHSVLFVLHPLCFLAGGILWANSSNPSGPFEKLRTGSESHFLQTQIAIIFLVLIYQVVYWNFYRKKHSTQLSSEPKWS